MILYRNLKKKPKMIRTMSLISTMMMMMVMMMTITMMMIIMMTIMMLTTMVTSGSPIVFSKTFVNGLGKFCEKERYVVCLLLSSSSLYVRFLVLLKETVPLFRIFFCLGTNFFFSIFFIFLFYFLEQYQPHPNRLINILLNQCMQIWHAKSQG